MVAGVVDIVLAGKRDCTHTSLASSLFFGPFPPFPWTRKIFRLRFERGEMGKAPFSREQNMAGEPHMFNPAILSLFSLSSHDDVKRFFFFFSYSGTNCGWRKRETNDSQWLDNLSVPPLHPSPPFSPAPLFFHQIVFGSRMCAWPGHGTGMAWTNGHVLGHSAWGG